MTETTPLRDPWLVAGWPGMGNVAVLACGHLVQQLRPARGAQLDPRAYFTVQGVQVSDGIATAARLPRSRFFEWRDPAAGRDLLIFVGEAQPAARGYELCQAVAEHAARLGVRRACTFAALATQLDLGTPPRVYAAATDAATLGELRNLGIDALADGQVGGLNGALLAAAAERGIPAACLLGEIPYFAANVPNPRAAGAVLGRFAEWSGIELDRSALLAQADAVEAQLRDVIDQMGADVEADEDEGDEGEPEDGVAGEPALPAAEPQLDPKTARRIEAMFQKAEADRSKAMELKRELDRLGVFKRYEDRFLDLFRRAG